MLKTVLEGSLVKTPLTYIREGKCTLKLLICHVEKSYSGNREIWIDCTVSISDSTILSELAKGDIVRVEGLPQAKLFTSKSTGDVTASLMLKAETIQLIGKGNHKPVTTLKSNDSL